MLVFLPGAPLLETRLAAHVQRATTKASGYCPLDLSRVVRFGALFIASSAAFFALGLCRSKWQMHRLEIRLKRTGRV